MSRYLSTYYFHGQDLCIVPRHVHEDVKWMADHGVDGVFVGVHDADLQGGNTGMVTEAIQKAGLDVWLIPSRLAGLVAGWGRQPSFLSVDNIELSAVCADGSRRSFYGPQLSVFSDKVADLVADCTLEMLKRFPARGIVWDELKSLNGEDHSSWAIEALGRPAGPRDMVHGTVDCFSRINDRLKNHLSELVISCFLYADSPKDHIRACSSIRGLDEFGCDGKCLRPGEADVGEGGPDKVLLGGQDQYFARTAEDMGLSPFTLLETQLLDRTSLELSLERLPEFLSSKEGHLAYYYYPYGMENPEEFMPRLGHALESWRRGV